MGFTTAYVNNFLEELIRKNYVALFTAAPDEAGCIRGEPTAEGRQFIYDRNKLHEPVIDVTPNGAHGGYRRAPLGTPMSHSAVTNTNPDRQRGNESLLLLFESRTNVTFTHFGIFDAIGKDVDASGNEEEQYGELLFFGPLGTPTSPKSLTVSDGSVPLIRAGRLIIGLDLLEGTSLVNYFTPDTDEV